VPPIEASDLLISSALLNLHSLVWGLVDSETIYKKVYREETIKVHGQLGFEHTFSSPQCGFQPEPEAPPLEEAGEAIVKIIDLTAHPSYRDEDAKMPIQNWKRDRIVIVPAYEELEREAYRSNERYIKNTNKTAKERDHLIPPRNIILTGVPGIGLFLQAPPHGTILTTLIGKSFAQNYLLFKRLSERKITAYQPFWAHRSGYYLFSEDGVLFVPAGSTGKDNKHHRNREIWALVDDDPLPEFSNVWDRNWMVVLTASPGRYSTSRWAKEQVVNTFYMRPWTWEEIEALR
jgi:hypothetical protein